MSVSAIVIGAGGHARVIADALVANDVRVLGFTELDASRHGTYLDGHPILGGDEILSRYSNEKVVLANGIGSVGAPVVRRAVHERLSRTGWRFVSVIHPRATVSPAALIKEGVQVMAGAVIQAGSTVCEGSIVNTSAVVDHDCILGAHCHIAPGAVLSGGVVLGDGCHVGAGAVVIQSIVLGPNTIVGAGAVVVRSFSAGSALLIGIPARSGSRQ